jgi:hypothetical protein|nr:MAG TPA: hypothetical protein [Caudoviricetes sp.]
MTCEELQQLAEKEQKISPPYKILSYENEYMMEVSFLSVCDKLLCKYQYFKKRGNMKKIIKYEKNSK